MTKRLAALIPLSLIAAVVVAPGIAQASNVPTHVSILISRGLGTSFHGQVSAPQKPACRASRSVKLERKKSSQTSFTTVGTDNSSSAGAWSVPTSVVANAQYRAVVASKPSGPDTCTAVTSVITTAFATHSSLAQGAGNFHGKVTSAASCVSPRTVKLQKKGIYQTTFSPLAGASGSTSASGIWSINASVPAGTKVRAWVTARQGSATASCMSLVTPAITAT
jgi:hypothetical protein